MPDVSVDFGDTTVTAGQVDRARRTVAHHATDAGELAEWLAMLGIGGRLDVNWTAT